MTGVDVETLVRLICKTSSFDFDYYEDDESDDWSIVFDDPYNDGCYEMGIHGEDGLNPESITIADADAMPGGNEVHTMTFDPGTSLEEAFEIFWHVKSSEVTYQTLEKIKSITVHVKTMNELTIDKNHKPIMFNEVMYHWSDWSGNEPIDEARRTRQGVTVDEALEDVKNKINVTLRSTDLTYSQAAGGLAGLLKSDSLMTGIPFHYGPESDVEEVFTMVWPADPVQAGMGRKTRGSRVSYTDSAMAIIDRKKFDSKFHLKHDGKPIAKPSNSLTVDPAEMVDAIADTVTALKIK